MHLALLASDIDVTRGTWSTSARLGRYVGAAVPSKRRRRTPRRPPPAYTESSTAGRLRQPEVHVHVHLPVHRRRGREMLLSRLSLAHASVHFSKAEMAVGHERSH